MRRPGSSAQGVHIEREGVSFPLVSAPSAATRRGRRSELPRHDAQRCRGRRVGEWLAVKTRKWRRSGAGWQRRARSKRGRQCASSSAGSWRAPPKKLATFCQKMSAKLFARRGPEARRGRRAGQRRGQTSRRRRTSIDGEGWEGCTVTAAGSNSLLRRDTTRPRAKGGAGRRRFEPQRVRRRRPAPALEKGSLHVGALTSLGEVIAGTGGRNHAAADHDFESQAWDEE